MDLTPNGVRLVERLAATPGPVSIDALADELYGNRTGDRNERACVHKVVSIARPRLRAVGLDIRPALGGGWYELAEAA
ncbi:MAG TPA: hypothetical protein VKR31_03915 [Rhizomicrobium sp.]|nr:hypothetical protein [Rhizomicrobium sp.]